MQQIIDLSSQTRNKVNERATKIRTYTKELMEVKKQMEATNNDIANAKSLIIRFANVLYRANNEYYN
jgi:ribosome-associated translation inhibitor RaiA